MVEEFRAFVPALKDDLSKLSNGPTALSYNETDRRLDFTPLSDYLVQRGAGPLIRAVLDVAYTIEFGREINRQSALALLFFIATNKRQAFTPFGVFSDERFHIVEGNDAVATAMAAGLPQPVQAGPSPAARGTPGRRPRAPELRHRGRHGRDRARRRGADAARTDDARRSSSPPASRCRPATATRSTSSTTAPTRR